MTPRKKKESVALMRLALLARCVHLHTVNDSVQYIGHERDIKEQVRKHRLLLE